MSSLLLQNAIERINERIRDCGWTRISKEERALADVHAFYGSVMNGGLDSVLFNSPYLGDMADELLVSLQTVGAVRAAAVFSEAFNVFPECRVPRMLDERVAHLRSMRCVDLFAELTARFYEEAETEEEALVGYIQRHPEVFGFE